MYSIGQFSHLTGITTKALIWYDKIGVLKPIKINEEMVIVIMMKARCREFFKSNTCNL